VFTFCFTDCICEVEDSFCYKHCRFSLNDISGKWLRLQMILRWDGNDDRGVGWGNLHGNGIEISVRMGWGWGKFNGDGDNFIKCVTV